MVLLMKVTWKVTSTCTAVAESAFTHRQSSTLKVSAAGTSSSLLGAGAQDETAVLKPLHALDLDTVEARPGRLTGLKNFISLPCPSTGDSSAHGDSTRLVSFTLSW